MDTAFQPWVDGFDFPASGELESQWRALLPGFAAQVMNRLRPSFGGALEYYDVPAWMTRVQTSDAAPGAGFCLAALDYLAWPATTPGRSEVLDRYLRQRHLDCWRDNGENLLTWLAVLRKLPEEWVPRDLLQRQIQRQLKATGIATAVEVEIELRLPVAGGVRWLAGQSATQAPAIRAAIAANGLCPVAVFTRDSLEAVLATEFEPELRCYDPAQPGKYRTIDHSDVLGVFPLQYTVGTPPLPVWQRFCGAVGLKGPAFRCVRAWRRRFRHAAV